MKSISKFFAQLHNDEGGAALLEYALLGGILVTVAVGGLAALGDDISAEWTTLANLF